ncbi:hypothetical protein [Thermosphaera aggregans]|nr:hypothetical protein [Thermosphaera aggregans]
MLKTVHEHYVSEHPAGALYGNPLAVRDGFHCAVSGPGFPSP